MEEKKVTWPGWEVVRVVGTGGFGSVYEIQRDVFGNQEKAALKVLSIPKNEDELDELRLEGYDDLSLSTRYKEYLQDIAGEYKLMAALKGHSNIVNCDDLQYFPQENGIGWNLYIKMELLTPLLKAIPGQPTEEQVIKIGMDMANALIACRKRNIIHRDIKPQNMFVSEDGNYKLGDFGVAKTTDRTASGTKTGTFKFMAPEVYNNKPYGASVDIYSLGMVLHWLLNERRSPFLPLPPAIPKASDEDDSRNRRFSGEPIPAPIHGSPALKAVVLKCCAFNPKDRYATPEALQQALQQVLGGGANQPVAAAPAAAPVNPAAYGKPGYQTPPANPVTYGKPGYQTPPANSVTYGKPVYQTTPPANSVTYGKPAYQTTPPDNSVTYGKPAYGTISPVKPQTYGGGTYAPNPAGSATYSDKTVGASFYGTPSKPNTVRSQPVPVQVQPEPQEETVGVYATSGNTFRPAASLNREPEPAKPVTVPPAPQSVTVKPAPQPATVKPAPQPVIVASAPKPAAAPVTAAQPAATAVKSAEPGKPGLALGSFAAPAHTFYLTVPESQSGMTTQMAMADGKVLTVPIPGGVPDGQVVRIACTDNTGAQRELYARICVRNVSCKLKPGCPWSEMPDSVLRAYASKKPPVGLNIALAVIFFVVGGLLDIYLFVLGIALWAACGWLIYKQIRESKNYSESGAELARRQQLRLR